MKIKDIDVLMKNIIAIFIAYKSIIIQFNPTIVIITLLFYIATLYSMKLFSNNKKIKLIIFLIEKFILVFLILKGYLLVIGLLVIDIFKVLIEKKLNVVNILIIIATGFYLRNFNDIEILMIVMVFTLVILIKEDENNKQINNLQNLELNQRNEIKKLNKKLIKEKEDRDQILRTSILEERNIISAKLHDKIGHVISGTLLQLEATKIIMEDDRKRAEGFIDKSISNLRNGMDDIRMTLRNIRPQKEELSINRLKNLLEEKLKNTRIKGRVNFKGNLDKVTNEMWRLFFEILMEGSTNSIKYSKGSNIEVNIEVLNKMIKFEVKDDGRGCLNLRKGIGLNSIEEKVRDEKGKLIINGERGFSLIVLISI